MATVVTVKMHHPHDGCKPGTKGHTGGNPTTPEGMPATPGAPMAGGMDINHPALNPISNPQGFAAHHAQQGPAGVGTVRQPGGMATGQPPAAPVAPEVPGLMRLR